MTLKNGKTALLSAALIAGSIVTGATTAAADTSTSLASFKQAALGAQLAQRFDPNDVGGFRDQRLRKRRMCARLRYMIYRSRNPAMRRYYRTRYYRLCSRR